MKWGTIYGAGSAGVEFYDAFHERIPGLDGDVEFYIRWAKKCRGPALELACGTGRVAIPMARAGIDVTGLDISPAMLKLARKKAAGLSARFDLGDMARFNLRRKFALIYIPFRSFQALHTPEQQRACLACVRRHLAPGGRFIVNIFDPKLEYCVHGRSRVISRYRTAVDPVTGRTCSLKVLERVNDALLQRLTEKWHFVVRDRSGKKLREDDRWLSIRWTYRWELAHLLELSGFETEASFSDFHDAPPRYGREQVVVARKR